MTHLPSKLLAAVIAGILATAVAVAPSEAHAGKAAPRAHVVASILHGQASARGRRWSGRRTARAQPSTTWFGRRWSVMDAEWDEAAEG